MLLIQDDIVLFRGGLPMRDLEHRTDANRLVHITEGEAT